MLNRIRDFSDGLRRTIASMENDNGRDDDWSAQIQQLRSGLQMMEEQSEIWDNGRQCISEMGEAIDQLSRVSHSLQRGVLDTRMVPVAPLFNRFKRVVRDLSKERGKQVKLQIRGETTELDKRMIDELGDPLVHLVRNSIDHGLEPTDVRVNRGKPEVGTIGLEASHRGNNVYIHVRDDGGGIDVDKIKAKLTKNQVLSDAAANELTDEQALEYIWHPGFSTAQVVTDVSGRGVGMDVVKTRVSQLNGTIEIESTPEVGTIFTIRLPLTLAIIHSLLARMRDVIFSMPIDDVREIVSVKPKDIVNVHGKRTFDVRGEFVPLLQSDDVFQWHGVDYGYQRASSAETSSTVSVVILHVGGRTVGLAVDELLGSQDIVIKSLSDNFMNIRGLSGASILGDGTVSLMLDVGTIIDLATKSPRGVEIEEKSL
jgi:two-component system chemotaxis sensor kinase CheA